MTARRIQVAVVDGAMTILGLALLCLGLWSVWKESLALAGTALGAGLVLLFAATIHRFESLKGLGMEAKTRKLDATIDKAEIAIDQLKDLAELVGAHLLNLVSSTGRIGVAATIMDAYATSREVKRILEKIGSSDAMIRKALTPWARYAAIDLFYAKQSEAYKLLTRYAAQLQLSGEGPPADQLSELNRRRNDIRTFQEKMTEDISSWPLQDIPRRLLSIPAEAPELKDEERSALIDSYRVAAEQITHLAEHLDFGDRQYWASIRRRGE